jgi:hypothetical protein
MGPALYLSLAQLAERVALAEAKRRRGSPGDQAFRRPAVPI